MNARESLAGNYLRKQFERLECGCIMSRSTSRLAGSESVYVGNASKVCTERSCPTHVPLDNVVSLLVKILVEK